MSTDEIMANFVAEIEQLTKDAGRYRWLRNECAEHHIGVYDYACNDKKRFWLQGAELDSEVDAAMQPIQPKE